MSTFHGYPYNRMTTVSAQGPEVQFDRQLLQTYIDLLGDNCYMFLPMLESDPAITVSEVIDHSNYGHHFYNVTAFDNDPCHKGLMLAYRFNGTDEGLAMADDAHFSVGSGAADTAFSVGCWFITPDGASAIDTLIARMDEQVAKNQEWELQIDAAGKINFRTHDDSVPAYIGRLYNTAISNDTWYFVVGTKTTGITSAAFDIYLAASTASSISAVDDTNSQNGVYVAAENKAVLTTVGYTADSGAGAGEWFQGQIWGPFFCAEALSSTTITNLFNQGKKLLGF